MDEQAKAHPWRTSSVLWRRLKPLARRMRREPTPAERRLWQQLRKRQVLGFKFRRQHAIGRFIVDFYCAEARLVVEVDGPVHKGTQEEDVSRQKFLESLGLKVLRFTNDEVFNALDAVVEQIAVALAASGSLPGGPEGSEPDAEDTPSPACGG
ncbi:MAG TPA: endonuclease domain-containing protein, partial [Chloroflexi bacterium]|nr:endonuclease domain-containing protein [Chloroflexota bacterium]